MAAGGQHLVGAGLQVAQRFGGFGAGGQRDHAAAAQLVFGLALAQAPDELEAVHERHASIGDDEIEGLDQAACPGFLSIAGQADAVAQRGQLALEQLAVEQIVFHGQDSEVGPGPGL